MPKNGPTFLKSEAKFLSFLCYYLTNVRAQNNLASFFQIFGPFLANYPPYLWLYLKNISVTPFKIIKYHSTIVTLIHWD